MRSRRSYCGKGRGPNFVNAARFDEWGHCNRELVGRIVFLAPNWDEELRMCRAIDYSPISHPIRWKEYPHTIPEIAKVAALRPGK